MNDLNWDIEAILEDANMIGIESTRKVYKCKKLRYENIFTSTWLQAKCQ